MALAPDIGQWPPEVPSALRGDTGLPAARQNLTAQTGPGLVRNIHDLVRPARQVDQLSGDRNAKNVAETENDNFFFVQIHRGTDCPRKAIPHPNTSTTRNRSQATSISGSQPPFRSKYAR